MLLLAPCTTPPLLPLPTQGHRKQRLMRRDFGKGENRRGDNWEGGKQAAAPRAAKHNQFLGAMDLSNPAFEEYYKEQVQQDQ